jgi:hypothetical protein
LLRDPAAGCRDANLGQAQRATGQRGHVACDTYHAYGVLAVGGDRNVQDGILHHPASCRQIVRERLSDAARSYGEINVWLGDDDNLIIE